MRILVTIAAALLGAFLGLWAGANVGGNYAPDFEFADQRGYEATGVLGAGLGAVFFAVVAWALPRARTRRG